MAKVYVEDFERWIAESQAEKPRAIGFLLHCTEHGGGLHALYLTESWELLISCATCKCELARVQVRSKRHQAAAVAAAI